MIVTIFNKRVNLLWLVMGIALLVRLAYALPLPADKLSPDAFNWMNIGESVATGSGFGDTWRPPGYAAYLGALFFVFGKSVAVGRAMNAVMGALLCLLIFRIGRILYNERAGIIAATLAAFYPYYIAYSGDMLSETFFGLMISWSVYLILASRDTRDWKIWCLTGAVLGFTSLTKSTITPFFLFALIWLAWRTRRFVPVLLIAAVMAGTISIWTVRNHFYYRHFIPISTMWRSFYGSNCDEAAVLEASGELDTPQPDSITEKAIPKDYFQILELPRMEQEAVFKERALLWISSNPDKMIWLMKKRFMHFWRLYPMMAYRWQKLAAKVTSGIYIPLCCIGLLLSWRSWRDTLLPVGLFVLFTGVHLFFAVTLRYRIPIDAFILIFAAAAITIIFERFASWLRKSRPANV